MLILSGCREDGVARRCGGSGGGGRGGGGMPSGPVSGMNIL